MKEKNAHHVPSQLQIPTLQLIPQRLPKQVFIEAIKDAEGNGCYHITARGKALLMVLRKANALEYE